MGKLLAEAGEHYGEGIIKEYSNKLKQELGKGYTVSSLKRMRQFYIVIKKGATVSHQLTWSHYCELLPLNHINTIKYYVQITIEQNLSVRELRNKIKNNEYERLDEKTKNKIITKEEKEVQDLIKNPILIKNKVNNQRISENVLKQLILEDLSSFLKELGNGFSFIDSEYKIKLGERYNYIDLLLFNYIYNAFIVVELKVTELKKEHIGQIEIYMNYIDKNLKTVNQNKTIGIIIVRKDNEFVMEYCSDERIYRATYELI